VSSSEGLRVRGVSAAWDGRPVLSEISLEVAPKEYVVLMGPNGSGKTTLLRIIAGLEPTAAGAVELDGRPLNGLPTHRRGIGMLFQDPALFLQRSVYENIAYALELRRDGAGVIEERVGELARLLHLEPLLERMPGTLSGGERQRVALARTLAPRPSIVLLDEPFASVDAELRAELMSEFRSVLRSVGTSALHVTHDREEGLFLGDRVLILLKGEIAQAGVPSAVYGSPATASVARFLGYNIVRESDGLRALHPAHVALGHAGAGRFDAEVLAAGFAGTERVVHLRTSDGERIEARLATEQPAPPPGTRVGVSWTMTAPVAG
jgi:thiamine transport system ATP-binding protein